MSPGEVNPGKNQQITSPSSPVNRPDRREVFVSIPAVDQHREKNGTPPSIQKDNQPKMQRAFTNDEDNINSQEPRTTHVHVQGNASWDIPVSESSQQTHVKTSKPQQKPLNEKRPFVSSVRSESYNAYLQSKESHLPRPKTKGSDAVKPADTSKVNNIQRPDGSRQNAGEKKMAGPYPTHAENRVMARRNMGAGQNERQVRTDQTTRRTVESAVENRPRSYHGGGETRVNDHSPVHPGANVVTQVQHYQSDGEDVAQKHVTKVSIQKACFTG